MTAKSHRFFVLLWTLGQPLFGLAAGGADSVWEGSPVGRCFESVESYLKANFGKDYANDENIKGIPFNAPKGQSLHWVIDSTPGVNPSRTLLSQKDGRVCAILFVPLSSSVTFDISTQGNFPDTATSLDTPPPGFDSNKIIYKLDERTGNYLPKTCLRVSAAGAEREIDCKQAFVN